jgi:hypothetical protein
MRLLRWQQKPWEFKRARSWASKVGLSIASSPVRLDSCPWRGHMKTESSVDIDWSSLLCSSFLMDSLRRPED